MRPPPSRAADTHETVQFRQASLGMPLQKFANVSDNRSLTVAALIGAPTVREGLHQDTRPYLRNGVL